MKPVPPGTFRGSRLKVERAKRHIEDLNRTLKPVLRPNVYRVVSKTNPNGPGLVWVVRVGEQFPEEASLIAGDALHNLRSALDILVYNLPGVPQTAKVKFPFGTSANDVQSRIKKTGIDRSTVKGVDKAILAFKPYKGGDDKLAGLSAIDVADKHHGVLPIATGASLRELIESKLGNIYNGPDRDIVFEDGNEAFRTVPGPGSTLEPNEELHPPVKIVFRGTKALRGEPVLETLLYLATLIDEIVTSFENLR